MVAPKSLAVVFDRGTQCVSGHLLARIEDRRRFGETAEIKTAALDRNLLARASCGSIQTESVLQHACLPNRRTTPAARCGSRHRYCLVVRVRAALVPKNWTLEIDSEFVTVPND